MKKIYKKPTIEYVDFTLSSSIAGSCTFDMTNFQSAGTCSADDGMGQLFVTIDGVYVTCDHGPQDDDPKNLCYHAPTSDSAIFAS